MKSALPQELIESDLENSPPIELETSILATKDDLASLNDLAFNFDTETPTWEKTRFLTKEPVSNVDVATMDETIFFSAAGTTAFEESVPIFIADEGIPGEFDSQNVGYGSFVKLARRFPKDF